MNIKYFYYVQPAIHPSQILQCPCTQDADSTKQTATQPRVPTPLQNRGSPASHGRSAINSSPDAPAPLKSQPLPSLCGSDPCTDAHTASPSLDHACCPTTWWRTFVGGSWRGLGRLQNPWMRKSVSTSVYNALTWWVYRFQV